MKINFNIREMIKGKNKECVLSALSVRVYRIYWVVGGLSGVQKLTKKFIIILELPGNLTLGMIPTVD